VIHSIRLKAFAKVNYALDVLGLRADGYHEIRTVMQSVSLSDEVGLRRVRDGFGLSIEPEEADAGPPERNTAYLAWKLLRDLTGLELPVEVTLRKRIPTGAGLGGGSADAAAVLVGLNEIFGLGLKTDELRGVGANIGADVPFCISGGTALGEGVGDVLRPLPSPPAHHLVVAKPQRSADTARVYRSFDASRPESLSSAGDVVSALRYGSLPSLACAVGNDLAPVTKGLVPEVARLERELLASGALGASMSGSGTAVYGLFDDEGAAGSARDALEIPFAGLYAPVSRGVERIGVSRS